MDFSQISNNTAVVIGGAVLVVVVAFFIFRSGSRKKERNKVPENVTEETTDTGGASKRESKRSILKRIRSLKKPEIEKDIIMEEVTGIPKPKLAEAAIPDEIFPGESGPSPEAEDNPLVTTILQGERAKAVVDMSGKTGSESEKPVDIPLSPDQDTAVVSEPPVKNHYVPAAEAENTNTDAIKPKDRSDTDAIFSMFTEVEEEENETSKFAAKLAPVDIDSLLRDARDIKKYISR
jgi:hypothetical protein